MYQILLVEDDKSIREVIADYMDEKGKDTMRLTLAEDGRACEGALERQTFDLILLDVMLPDIDGFTLCRTIRKKDMVPIVFLTAKGSEEDILWGYGLGCDDYIVKPFSRRHCMRRYLPSCGEQSRRTRKRRLPVARSGWTSRAVRYL